MLLLKRLYVYDELVKKVNAIQTTDTSDLSRKADYKPKIENIEKRFLIIINISHSNEFNKLMKGSFAESLKQANLANKSDIADFVKKTD